MGLTLLKLSSSCIFEIIMVLLRIISGISLLPSLIGFLCAYCIFPRLSIGWSFGPLLCLRALGWLWVLAPALQPLWVIGIPRYSAGFAGQWSFAPAILRVLWYLRTFFLWYSTGYDSNWAIRPFHDANLILRLRVTLLCAR